MKKFFKLKYIFIVLILALIGFVYFNNKQTQKETNAKFPTKYNSKTQEIITVKKQDISSGITLSGFVDAEEKADLVFQTSGQLSWVGVKVGDSVKKYQSVASLNKEILKKQLQTNFNNYKSASSVFYDTTDEYKDSAITTEIKRILERNQNTLDNSIISYELGDLAIKYATLSTPISGIITNINYPNSGVNIVASQPIISVVNPESIYFSSKIDQDDVNKIKIGNKAIINIDSFSDEKIDSEITYIAFTPISGESSTVYKLKFKFPVNNKDLKYRLGMDGDVNIILSKVKDVLTISTDAIIEDENKQFVLIKNNDNTLTKKEIITGIENDTDIEVKEGLTDNDQIIIKK